MLLNRFVWRTILTAIQLNFSFPQNSYSKYCHWTYFIKTIEYLSFKFLWNLVQFLNVLKTSRSSNCLNSNVIRNLIFVSFSQNWVSVSTIFQNNFYFWFYYIKKRNPQNALLRTSDFCKNIHNFIIKMFYQNCGQIFVICN